MTGVGGTSGRALHGVGFWAQQKYYNIFSVDSGPFIFRPPLRSLPDQPLPPNAFQSWTYSYNLNLIGKDRMIVGDQVYDLAPGQRPSLANVEQYTWLARYNPNLIGKDRLPVGDQVWELPPRDYPRLSTYTWLQSSTALTLTPPTNFLPRPVLRSLPDRPAPPLLQQSTFPNFNVLHQAVATTFRGILRAVVDGPPPQVPSWTWSYNVNLIGEDHFPVGEMVYDRPQTPAALPQTWIQPTNIALTQVVGTTFRPLLVAVVPQPQVPVASWIDVSKFWLTAPVRNVTIDQYWDRPQLPVPPARSWEWSYNLNLIGKDRLPTGEQVWERPTLPIPPAQTWLDLPKYSLIAKPFFQSDWPNPTQPYRIDATWAASYNLNLIGQDRLPVGVQVSDLPPRDFSRLFQTWISSVNLALTVTPPALTQTLFKQITDLAPRGAEPDYRRSWEWQYNKNLIGQDQLPFRQQDWPLTPAPQRAAEWIQQTNIALLTAVQRPFVQSDWPLPQAPAQAVQTWINTIGLALTAKPFNQQDWPNPTPPARDPTLNTVAASYNRNLIGQDRLPFNQHDWPVPAPAPQPLLQIMVQGKPFFLVPPQPLPPGAQFFDRPTLRQGTGADLYWPAWRWPQITPPPVTGVIPLRTLMGTGV